MFGIPIASFNSQGCGKHPGEYAWGSLEGAGEKLSKIGGAIGATMCFLNGIFRSDYLFFQQPFKHIFVDYAISIFNKRVLC